MYHVIMAKLTTIRDLGNNLVVVADDGRSWQAVPGPGGLYNLAPIEIADAKPVDPPVTPPVTPPVGDGSDWQWPFKYSRYVLQNYPLAQYGDRINPVTHKPAHHNGLDFGGAGIKGLPIPAACAGKVVLITLASKGDARGNSISIQHSGGFQTNYFHMKDPATLAMGASVDKGTILGQVGTTGRSTGEHLHWETMSGGKFMNPRDFMKERGVPES